MSWSAGVRLGSYEIVSRLGAGGMGEVYRATDTNLGRDVAIKVLPDAFANDADRLARFEREARTLAALNHPNIAHIYGLEKTNGAAALVMELAEGDDLSDRIARGAIPLEEALPIARQIADALDAAHEQGIVHRDLKPANIKLRSDGTVKVLDFGLAKLTDHSVVPSAPGSMTMSPTILSAATMTGVGVLLGTAAYMAPEQASGRAVDKRADIWAFGVVLAEMLTGQRLFDGDSVPHVLAAILTQEPDLSAVPSRVQPLLRRCLEKDPKRRLRDIGDAMSLVLGTDVAPAAATRDARSRRWLSVGGWTVAGVLAIVLGVAAARRSRVTPDADTPPIRFQIERALDVYNRTTSAFAVSPDGVRLAYYGPGRDVLQTLFIRTLATGDVREVPGSASVAPQADSVFWSPDSRQLVRGTANGGQIFDLTTGTTRALCECRYVGGTWNRDGTILIGSFGTPGSGIRRLSPGDRTPRAITTVDTSQGETDTWPVFLTDGRRFLFTRSRAGGTTSTYAGTLDGGAPTQIAEGSRRIFVPATAGHEAYLAGIDAAGLVIQPFDPVSMRVTGPELTLVPGAASASASQNGILATSAAGSRPRTVPTWFTRAGTVVGRVGDAGLIDGVALSRDGRRLAVSEGVGGARPIGDVWLRDLLTGARTRFTFNPENDGTPVWSPDGTRLAFTSTRNGVNLPYQRAADGTGAETPLFPYEWHAWVNDWSSDGRWVLFSTPTTRNAAGNDLWFVRMDGATPAKPGQYLATSAIEQQAQFSPDGRFVAYGSDQSGTWEIYVQPFPDASQGKWMVSNGGGVEPRWSRDGKELFYFSNQTLMAVPITLQPSFSNGSPHALFDASVQPGYTADSHRWQVAPDGTRFLLLVYSGTNQPTPLDVIVNWWSLVKK